MLCCVLFFVVLCCFLLCCVVLCSCSWLWSWFYCLAVLAWVISRETEAIDNASGDPHDNSKCNDMSTYASKVKLEIGGK